MNVKETVQTEALPWYAEHRNIVQLTSWLAEEGGYSAKDIAYAVEKPWKYEADFRAAQHNHDGAAYASDSVDGPAVAACHACGWTWTP